MILKFLKSDNNIVTLLDYEMTDISSDFKTKLLDKKQLTNPKYKIDNDIFMLRQPFFLHIANTSDKPNTKALYIKYSDNKQVIIIGKDDPFYNNKPLDPDEYKLPFAPDIIMKKLIKIKK